MQEILFTKDECNSILNGINNSTETLLLGLSDRKYKHWLVTDKVLLGSIEKKLKSLDVTNIIEGRILKYETGDFFENHYDTYDEYPHRYKTILVQLSDTGDYEGGVLTFGDEVLGTTIGTTTIFDSVTTLHGMSPIISGTRYVLVVWLERNDFLIRNSFI